MKYASLSLLTLVISTASFGQDQLSLVQGNWRQGCASKNTGDSGPDSNSIPYGSQQSVAIEGNTRRTTVNFHSDTVGCEDKSKGSLVITTQITKISGLLDEMAGRDLIGAKFEEKVVSAAFSINHAHMVSILHQLVGNLSLERCYVNKIKIGNTQNEVKIRNTQKNQNSFFL